ncbi:MAG TPA: SUMF1/EgtB/PvdO family nonheme iron enzyme [Polyangiaceae bacterium]|nr:SUMF1/EgtB/PvdO family nonheme iron enzyme [Polyangiaceae bacterium]
MPFRSLCRWMLAPVAIAAQLAFGCTYPDDVIALPAPVLPCDLRCGLAECPCPADPHVPIDFIPGAGFAIDATEVTVQQYSTFMKSRPTPERSSAQPQCTWNESYEPVVSTFDVDPNCRAFDYEALLIDDPQRPVVCIDHCDAVDYCEWRGGHLCGRMGGGGLLPGMRGSRQDEWYNACSAGDLQPYCYGSVFDPVACNSRFVDNQNGTLRVASLPDCEGPALGLFDMNGNVKEWVFDCEDSDPPASSSCYRVGGAFFEGDANSLRCDSATEAQRSTLGHDTGFRCCYDRAGG